ncbi:MAG: cupin domain-containing protein [Sphingomonas sp.]|uniref:cupin domain-containing protein n=1 Tax=Sphingomonas sp. TaxID=28214 RepID=UPI003F387695
MIKPLRKILFSPAAFAAILWVNSALAQPAQPERVLLGCTPVPGTALETRLYLITYPPGVAAHPHVHPVVGVGYVLEGEAESRFRGGALVHLKAGDRFADLATTPHDLFRNARADRPPRFEIAYTIEQGAPTLTPLP